MNDDSGSICLRHFLSALSYALDLTEGQPVGHCIRGCWIGTHTAMQLDLNEEELADCYFTLLLKDAGCSSNAARLCELYCSDDLKVKYQFKTVDTDDILQVAKFVFKSTGLSVNMKEKYKKIFYLALNKEDVAKELITTRCERGANIARKMGLREAVARGIYSLDEHYNGKGKSRGLKGKEIPLESRIALLAQCADVFYQIGGKNLAIEQVNKRANTWFDPEIVSAFNGASKNEALWQELNNSTLEKRVLELLPESQAIKLSLESFKTVVEVFGTIIDAKSPYTAGHSKRVAQYAQQIGQKFGLKTKELNDLHYAAALHDLGKLGVSNLILDKPGKLTVDEWRIMKKHPQYSQEILSRLHSFETIAKYCGAHHEKLNGTGYYLGLKNKDITLQTRIITVADIYDALTADRPYRDAMPIENARKILIDMKGDSVDGECVNLLFER